MHVVIDTHQASLLPPGKKGWTVSLAPHVLAEILLRTNPTPTLELLRVFHTRLGLETLDIMVQLAQSSAQEIQEFEPFPAPGRSYRQNYDAMLAAVDGPTKVHMRWARHIKSQHHQYCYALLSQARQLRKLLRKGRTVNYKYSTFEEALSAHALTPDAFLGSIIVGAITNDGQRSTRTQPAELLDAVLANQYLGRFFRAQLAYALCLSRVWKDQDLNFDPSPIRDDVTDITLPLYAEDGDVIVTADTRLAQLVSLIDPQERVKIRKADEIA